MDKNPKTTDDSTPPATNPTPEPVDLATELTASGGARTRRSLDDLVAQAKKPISADYPASAKMDDIKAVTATLNERLASAERIVQTTRIALNALDPIELATMEAYLAERRKAMLDKRTA